MRKVVLLAVAMALPSVAAFAQMHHGQAQPGEGMMQGQGPGMHQKMRAMMQAKKQGAHGNQQTQDRQDAHAPTSPKGDRGPSSLAFHGINQQMHEGMNITFSGNADVDFVTGMIPHHNGAVQMAKVVLAFGTDPEIRQLAEAIIKAQESEIALMRAWLKRNAQAPAGQLPPAAPPHTHH